MFFSKIVLLAGVVAHGVLAMPLDIESRTIQFSIQQQEMINVTGNLFSTCGALEGVGDKLSAISDDAPVAQTVAALQGIIHSIIPFGNQLDLGILGILGGSLSNLNNLPVNGILGGCLIGVPELLGGLTGCGLSNLLGDLASCSDIIGALGPAGSLLSQLTDLNNILNGSLLAGLLGPGGAQVAQLVSAITTVINTLKELHDTIEPSCGCADALIAELVLLLNQLVTELLQLLGIGLTNCVTVDVVTVVNQLLAASGLNF